MKYYDLITPEGTNDLLFEDCIARKNVESIINEIFIKRGYQEIITPGLEFFDVFNLKSRHFAQEDLYKMVDRKGRLLLLRPESTMPIARVVATRLKEASLPLRLYYNQCAYNISPLMTGRSDQIVQAGIELIGSDSLMADIEVIDSAIEVLSKCKVEDFSVEIGDIGLFKELVNKLDINDIQKENIRSLIEMKNYPALNDLLDSIGNDKIIYSLKKLPRLFGGNEVFEKAAKLFSDEKIDKILSKLQTVYNDISSLYPDYKITVDLGMVNKTDYYTGIIIKGYIRDYGEAVLSGGRYDKLISEFRYDVPATGFAINVDAVAKVISKTEKFSVKIPDVIVFSNKEFYIKAFDIAKKYREEGLVTEIALFDNIDDVREYAKEKQIQKIVLVNENVTEVN